MAGQPSEPQREGSPSPECSQGFTVFGSWAPLTHKILGEILWGGPGMKKSKSPRESESIGYQRYHHHHRRRRRRRRRMRSVQVNPPSPDIQALPSAPRKNRPAKFKPLDRYSPGALPRHKHLSWTTTRPSRTKTSRTRASTRNTTLGRKESI